MFFFGQQRFLSNTMTYLCTNGKKSNKWLEMCDRNMENMLWLMDSIFRTIRDQTQHKLNLQFFIDFYVDQLVYHNFDASK